MDVNGRERVWWKHTTYKQDGQSVHPVRLWVPQKYSRNLQGTQGEFSPSCLPADEDFPTRLLEWMTAIASVTVPKFPG